MIIAISGKIGSGKDTIGSIIQYLASESIIKNKDKYPLSFDKFIELEYNIAPGYCNWQIKKFADKLKDMVCLVLNCTREQLEDINFKNKLLGEEWIRYGRADGFFNGGSQGIVMNNASCTKEEYEAELRINWQTAYKFNHTPRSILQMLGTEVGRFIHLNFWVNALFVDYKPKSILPKEGIVKSNNTWKGTMYCENCNNPTKDIEYYLCETCINSYPNWVITDLRFPNEAEVVKKHSGITIRVNRYLDLIYPKEWAKFVKNVGPYPINEEEFLRYCSHEYPELHAKLTHPSETSLDDYEFDHVIDNNGTIDDLIIKVKEILEQYKII